MQVEDEVVDALRDEPGDDAADERLARHRDRRLRADVGQRTQPGAEAGGQHEGVSNHNPIALPPRVNSRRMKTYIVKHSSAKAGKPK